MSTSINKQVKTKIACRSGYLEPLELTVRRLVQAVLQMLEEEHHLGRAAEPASFILVL